MSYYSDDEEIDVRVRRGRGSPIYDNHRPRHYYRGDRHLEIATSHREHSRSRSRDRRAPSPQPIIINNRVENRQDDYDDDRDDRRYMQVAAPVRRRSVSRQRDPRYDYDDRGPRRESGYMSREDYELERTRKELERYKLEKQREEDEKTMKKEMELKRLREEKRAEEEKKAKKEAEERAVKEWKAKEAEKKEKERKEKEQRDKEYKERLEDDLRRSGMDDRQIALVLKKDKDKKDGAAVDRPTFTRMARRYLSIETLNYFRIDYQLDQVSQSFLSVNVQKFQLMLTILGL
jgi:hypothetical protein